MTNNSKDALDSLMEGIEYVVQSQVKSAPFDKIKNGKIVAKNIDGTYEVSIENQLYSVPPLGNKDLPNGSIVKVVIPQNNYSHMFILTAGNEVPPGTTDYLDLENKPAINGHTLVGNQTAADLGITGEENVIETIKVNGTAQTVTNKAVDITVPTQTSQLTNNSGFITKDVNNLTNYEVKADVGHSIVMSMDNTTYVLTISLKNSAGTILNTQTVDFPLETMVVNGEYDSTTKEIVLTLDNGNVIRFSVADLVSGLQSEITNDNKLASDLVDDTNQLNKFVTATEKTTWNAKYDKPSNGIPKTDLDSAVQTSLGKADTSVQPADIANMEVTTNKVTTLSSENTDIQYPSAKAVYDNLITATTSDNYIDNSADLGVHINYVGADNVSQIQYKEATYIESSGTQYIDTGVPMSNVTKVEIDAQLVSLSSGSTYPAFVGGRWNTSNGFQLIYNASSGVISGRWKGNSYTVEYTDYSRFTASLSTTEFIVNGTTLGSYTSTAVSDTLPLLLFVRYQDTSGSTKQDYSNSKLYSCKIYNGETLLRDFVPAQDVSDNSYGLFDKVEKKFYGNAGTGSFSGSVTSNYISPNPNYPQAVKTFSGNVSIGVQNKNLFDKSTMSTRIYAYILDSGTTWRYYNDSYSVRIPALPNTTYTISANNSNETIFRGCVTDSEDIPTSDNSITIYSTTRHSNTNVPIIVTTGANAKYIVVQVAEETASATLNTLQVEIGSTATSYVQHEGQTYPLTLGNIFLGKLGTAKNLIFKNEVGSPYYKSTLTEGAFYWHKEWSKETLSGATTENWGTQNNCFTYSVSDLYRTYTWHDSKFKLLCTCLVGVSSRSRDEVGNNQIAKTNSSTQISAKPANITTLENWKTYLSTNPMTIYYWINTATDTEITDSTLVTQLNNLWDNMQTYENVTNIVITGADISGELNFTYVKNFGFGNNCVSKSGDTMTGNLTIASNTPNQLTIDSTGTEAGIELYRHNASTDVSWQINNDTDLLKFSNKTMADADFIDMIIFDSANNEVDPATTNTYSLGSSTLKYAGVYATTFNGDLSGNAATATKLQTAVTINKISFDGSANILVPYLSCKDLRTSLLPSDVSGDGKYITAAFASEGAVNSGSNNNKYIDAWVLSSWGDSSGGAVNMLWATKTNAQALWHYRATYGASSWSAKKQIAYTDSNITGSAASATADSDGNTITNTYVHKAGDTMTGALTINDSANNQLNLKSGTTSASIHYNATDNCIEFIFS